MKRLLKWLAIGLVLVIIVVVGFAAVGYYRVYYGKHVYETAPPRLPDHLVEPAMSAIIQKRIFLNGRGMGQHHPRRRRNHPSDYPYAWRLLKTSLQTMASLV
jgi:hypothetical protein